MAAITEKAARVIRVRVSFMGLVVVGVVASGLVAISFPLVILSEPSNFLFRPIQ